MENKELTIKDIIESDGLYENYIVSKGKLFGFVLVEALNLDMEDTYVMKNILANYSSFLLVLKSRNENIMNVTMTAKNNTEQTELYWKRKLLEVDKREDLDEQAKQNVRQLIASKIIDIQDHVRHNESIIKQHFMVVSQKIEGTSYEEYERAAEKMKEKCNTIISEMHEWLRNCNRDLDLRIADNQESLKILQHFIDNKIAMLS